jgi:hypothetical protein
MNLMLTLMLASIVVGLAVPRVGPRQYLLAAAFATVATAMWFASLRWM